MTNGRHTGKILVVDDDRGAMEALSDILEYEGYQVERAQNGLQALEHLKETRPSPNLIILDLLMPVMDGWEFRLRQKEDPELAKIPVLVVTAIGATAGIDAAGVLRKPVDVDVLLRTVARYCD
ncbi:MAG TPA: response regulator [Candidatus Binataceae bacterium]|nr:response regulator [Candidatus Binataceae bacterium]